MDIVDELTKSFKNNNNIYYYYSQIQKDYQCSPGAVKSLWIPYKIFLFFNNTQLNRLINNKHLEYNNNIIQYVQVEKKNESIVLER